MCTHFPNYIAKYNGILWNESILSKLKRTRIWSRDRLLAIKINIIKRIPGTTPF